MLFEEHMIWYHPIQMSCGAMCVRCRIRNTNDITNEIQIQYNTIKIQWKYNSNTERGRMWVERLGWLDRRAAGNWHFHPEHQQPDTYYKWNSNTFNTNTLQIRHKYTANTTQMHYQYRQLTIKTFTSSRSNQLQLTSSCTVIFLVGLDMIIWLIIWSYDLNQK